MNVAFILFVATDYKNITNFMFVSNISKKSVWLFSTWYL